MRNHDVRKSLARMAGVTLKWPDRYFEAEARINGRERLRLPLSRSTLKAGDRVSFELGEGVDGPVYATNVRLIEPD